MIPTGRSENALLKKRLPAPLIDEDLAFDRRTDDDIPLLQLRMYIFTAEECLRSPPHP